MNYADYLRTTHWKKVRDAAVKRANHRCQLCYSNGPLEVHHRTYLRRGRERSSDVIALCDDCHEIFHREGKLSRSDGGPSPALIKLVQKQMRGAA